MEEDPAVEDTYYSEEDTDEDIPGEKDDLQKRIKELKRVRIDCLYMYIDPNICGNNCAISNIMI